MWNKLRKVLTLFCVLYLWQGVCAEAEAASPGILPFYEDGDIVGFIGDSITHVTYSRLSYAEMLEEYYLSRFPGQRVEFRNLGTAGYKAVDVLNIYDKDPALGGIDKAVIMLGTNEAILGVSAEEYIGHMGELVERLKEDGLQGEDILLITPPICDQNCSMNRDKNGNLRWRFEDTLLGYIDALEPKAQEWGVYYLDIHTPMAELTAKMQAENAADTLTTDCIHPNAEGQRLIAYYILRAQGAGEEPLSAISVTGEGEVQAAGGELTDFYRGEKGMCWTWKPETLPVAGAADAVNFRSLFEQADVIYRKAVQAEGFGQDTVYRVWMGETEVGSYTGADLAEGIDLGMPETHPQQEVLAQIDALYKTRHQEAVKYRNIWIEIAMQRAVYVQEEIQAQYTKWKNADEKLWSEIYALADELAGNVFRISIVEEGYTPEELSAEAEQARIEEEERAKREAEEKAEREAEEKAEREAEEKAEREAEEQARKEAEKAAIAAEEQAEREAEEAATAAEKQEQKKLFWKRILIGTGLGVICVLAVRVWIRKKKAL